MNEVSPTALPWSCGPTGSNMREKYSQTHAISDASLTQLVAGCFGDVRGGEAQAEANSELIVKAVNNHAKLILALSESLEVLKADLRLAEFQLGQCVTDDFRKFFASKVEAKKTKVAEIETTLRRAQ